MELVAKKDKIILVDVQGFEKQEAGFEVKNSNELHDFGTIFSVPEQHKDSFKEGEIVVLRPRIVPDTLTVENVKYSFVQPIDILCQLKK